MTLRDLFKIVHLNGKNGVYEYLYKKEKSYAYKCDRHTLKQITSAYSKVVNELLTLKHNKPDEMSICVKSAKSFGTYENYIEVCLLNHNYEKPNKGLKPWGGEPLPQGHYNCNLDKYNKFFSIGPADWNKYIDTPIINKVKNLSLEGQVAEILYELTFWGFTNKQVKTDGKKLEKTLTESVKWIDKQDKHLYTVEDLKKKLNER